MGEDESLLSESEALDGHLLLEQFIEGREGFIEQQGEGGVWDQDSRRGR